MSIIYDALQKAEGKKPAIVGDNPGGAAHEVVKKIKKSPKEKRQFFLGFIMLAAIAAFLLINNNPVLKAAFPTVDEKKVKPKKRVSVPEKQYAPDHYILEGILYDGDTPLAVINGKVLSRDQTVGNLRITNITSSSVELLNLNDNSKTTLTF